MGHGKRETQREPQAAAKAKAKPAGDKAEHPTRSDEILQRVEQLAAAGHYEKAFDLLKSAGREPRILNARGVCLLRLGRFDEAVRVFRDLVLKPGCTWMRLDLPALYKTNYATALLLAGHPSGCLEIITEINQEQDAAVQRLRAAIKRWKSTLSFWQWLNWRVGQIEPAHRPVTIDFAAGEFESLPVPRDTPRPVTPRRPREAA